MSTIGIAKGDVRVADAGRRVVVVGVLGDAARPRRPRGDVRNRRLVARKVELEHRRRRHAADGRRVEQETDARVPHPELRSSRRPFVGVAARDQRLADEVVVAAGRVGDVVGLDGAEQREGPRLLVFAKLHLQRHSCEPTGLGQVRRDLRQRVSVPLRRAGLGGRLPGRRRQRGRRWRRGAAAATAPASAPARRSPAAAARRRDHRGAGRRGDGLVRGRLGARGTGSKGQGKSEPRGW